jgi:PleD family two-component response regulator
MSHEDEQSPVADWPLTKVILMVEDTDVGDASIAHILPQVTRHRVFVASNDRAALKFARYVRPDAFVLHCPDAQNAIELSRQLHTPVDTQTTPTIVIGTFDLKLFGRFADEIRAYGLILIHEPLQMGHLLNAIEKLLP